MARNKKEAEHRFIENLYSFNITFGYHDSDYFGKQLTRRYESYYDGSLTNEQAVSVLKDLETDFQHGKVTFVEVSRKPHTVFSDYELSKGGYPVKSDILHFNRLNVKTASDLENAISETRTFLESKPEEQTRPLVW